MRKAGKQKPVKIIGDEIHYIPHADLRPNGWNPNRMTAFERESLKHGLQTDGWLLSQSLTVWASDEKGGKQYIIIDGEHRWTAAGELGMPECPAVLIHKISESYAKELTIKLFQRRGRPDEDKLGALIRSIPTRSIKIETRSLDLGIKEEKLSNLLRPKEKASNPPSKMPSGQAPHVKLFFSAAESEEFVQFTNALAVSYETENVTETVLRALNNEANRIGR